MPDEVRHRREKAPTSGILALDKSHVEDYICRAI
jgi:hypothetical protein